MAQHPGRGGSRSPRGLPRYRLRLPAGWSSISVGGGSGARRQRHGREGAVGGLRRDVLLSPGFQTPLRTTFAIRARLGSPSADSGVRRQDGRRSRDELAQALMIFMACRAAFEVCAHSGQRRVGVGTRHLEVDVVVEQREAPLAGHLGADRPQHARRRAARHKSGVGVSASAHLTHFRSRASAGRWRILARPGPPEACAVRHAASCRAPRASCSGARRGHRWARR